MQQADRQYQKLLTEIIKKQIVILGQDITLTKARNVKGLTISEDGTITAITGNPQELVHELIDQFLELSPQIVNKTIEPILAGYPDIIPSIQSYPMQKSFTTPPPATRSNTPPAPLPAPIIIESKIINDKPESLPK